MIRAMKKSDLDQVMAIEHECFTVPWARETFRNGLSDRLDFFWVWEEDGKIAGYSNLRIILDEAELNRIVVQEKFRGRGIAKQLMDTMVSFSSQKGVTAITLEVRISNCIAQNLYRVYGFKQEGIRRNYYFDPVEDAVIMWKR